MEVKKIAKEWKIWNEKEEVAKSEKKGKESSIRIISLVDSYVWKESKWTNTSERKKIWDYAIKTKKGFVLRK